MSDLELLGRMEQYFLPDICRENPYPNEIINEAKHLDEHNSSAVFHIVANLNKTSGDIIDQVWEENFIKHMSM